MEGGHGIHAGQGVHCRGEVCCSFAPAVCCWWCACCRPALTMAGGHMVGRACVAEVQSDGQHRLWRCERRSAGQHLANALTECGWPDCQARSLTCSPCLPAHPLCAVHQVGCTQQADQDSPDPPPWQQRQPGSGRQEQGGRHPAACWAQRCWLGRVFSCACWHAMLRPWSTWCRVLQPPNTLFPEHVLNIPWGACHSWAFLSRVSRRWALSGMELGSGPS